jgi:biopolymer transport protein ExbD
MSAGTGNNGGQDFDLNLAPIIDCFTVLITFMLVSASFLTIGILDAGVEAAGQTASNAKPPEVTIQLTLKPANSFDLKVTGKGNLSTNIQAKDGKWDLDRLRAELDGVKKRWPASDSLVLSAGDQIEYRDVVQAMDAARKIFPGVLLGGF